MKTIQSTNGTKLFVYEDGEKEPTYEEMKEMVGGYIEVVYLNFPEPIPDDEFIKAEDLKWYQEQMIVNEEGLLKHLPLNVVATRLYWSGTRPGHSQKIVGNAIHLKGSARLS